MSNTRTYIRDLGSHLKLAEYLSQDDRLEKLAVHGHTALPTGEKTDALLGTEVVHCTGRAGDVFIANYLTAHLVAPNVSPNIRYAVYFRIRGPSFEGLSENRQSMLNPLMNWKLY